MKNIYEHIRKARIEAQRQFIAANTIIIDKEIAYTNNLFVQDNNIIGEYPPMIFGMKVLYDNNLPNNANFVITNVSFWNLFYDTVSKGNGRRQTTHRGYL